MPLPIRRIALFLALSAAPLLAQSSVVPDQELAEPPSRARIEAILAAAKRDGWAPQSGALRAAALHAYERGNLFTADAWFHVYAWSAVLGQTDTEFTTHWIEAVNAAHVGHANMPRDLSLRDEPLALSLSPELQQRLLADADFSAEFFGVLSRVDYLPRVFEILSTLYRADPNRFNAYTHLALAIAIVYDVPPPPNWPHAQVGAAALPRRFPPPLDAFNWWVRQDQLGHTFLPLRELRTDELKFVVDSLASFTDLEWAQRAGPATLSELPQAYSEILYRTERFTKQQGNWPGRTYRLSDIYTQGGICTDQAYFAFEVGKARGVPTLLFGGSGNDGRHAWFGYLDANHRWQLDAGRYAEERFVTGFARDPQTWAVISDHELQFLAERFRAQVSYRESRVHEEFASMLLTSGDAVGASAAARKAVDFESRNESAWETLIAAKRQETTDPRAIEVLIREAALAFRRYPDLETAYIDRLAASLRARGQTSEADAEVARLAHRYQSERLDLSVQQARDIVRRAMNTQPLDDQIRTYNYAVDTFGSGAGMTFFDEVVRLFVEHLWQLGHRPEATRALERARVVLGGAAHTQLESEFAKLEKTITTPVHRAP